MPDVSITAFWNDDRVRAIYNPVVQQIPVCVGLKVENGKMLLTDCLLSLVGCADGDPLLKAINLAIIQHSKSEDARIRLYSLSCSVSIWEKFGRKLSGPLIVAFAFSPVRLTDSP